MKILQIVYLSFVIVTAKQYKYLRDGENNENATIVTVAGLVEDIVDALVGDTNKTTTKSSEVIETDPTTLSTLKTETNYDAYPWEVLCKFQLNPYPCQELQPQNTYYYDMKLEDCKKGKVNKICPHSSINTFSSLSNCVASCREPGSHQITTDLSLIPEVYCRLQPDFGFCNDYHPRFYFDLGTRECRGFSWSGCGGNLNRFDTDHECMSKCLPEIKY